MNTNEHSLSFRPASREVRLPRRVRAVLRLLEGLRGGAVALQLPGMSPLRLGEGEVVASWTVTDLAMFDQVIASGDIGLGESWMDGQWHCDNLSALLGLLAANRESLGRAVRGSGWSLLLHRLAHLARKNTRRGSRRNIAAHYDLGNEFYRLWLDPSMTYSSAVFAHADEPLIDAQTRKYRRILDQLGAQPGQRILEVGCGWGGFAEIAARDYGCEVHGITLSPRQRDLAQARADAGGWADRVYFELRDYRDVQGTYDHIVSIEMIEAVGEAFWPTYYAQLKNCLAPGGRVVIQAITINETLFDGYRRGTDFIQRYIFPGGMLPTPTRVSADAGRAGLETVDRFDFGLDYARTLQRWAVAFNSQQSAVRVQGFDDRFVRMWQFYLAYCEAGFVAGDLGVHHFCLAHAEPERAQ
ncbi:SAM-dependent methyltransferase [Denitromonas ohlonensis]|uniref:Class I SAM-dependent methyltransferase n=2 Tax=Denitromonas TaxID=139331 RepID=A0A557SFK4_9RHOO|nr:cyclopropane-fatty-acyl-phospholipid synthase family protein [Denitromonas ohlonensis]TVO63255.1 class I SAM-dependent methyltransferase [Denitromonas ohlonensis]TVO76198.1 class I SAM-dependent methyltransferase [Denitromonas ohlonensis]TVT47552.1 MAG: class I SAM-dependent methyltransferase [Denitromonas halophila]TVT69985.1 MAG: class I SAM-dependent methyltransferase [Denitromonas halophila]